MLLIMVRSDRSTRQVDDINELNIPPEEIVGFRKSFNMSQGVFARLLHTSSRTLENREQG